MRTRRLVADSRQSTWLDVGVFAAVLVLGMAAYLGLRAWLGSGAQIWVTLTLVGLMVAYGIAVVWVPRLHIRLDQAGDNAYYLGLLFTLASMAFALYDFGTATRGPASATGVQQIISNFGIALATTIAGIFLRVALHQMRVDPADLEATTRIELTEAAERVRATMDNVTTELGRFHLEVQQRSSDVMAELFGKVKTAATEVAEQAAAATGRLSAATEEAHTEILTRTGALTKLLTDVATEATGAMERLRAVEPPPLTLSRRLDRVAAVLEQVAVHSERTTNALSGTSEATARSIEAVAKTAEMLNRLALRMRDEQAEVSDRLAKTSTGLVAAIDPFATRLQQVLAHLAQLQDQSKQSGEESIRAQQAATEVLSHLTKIVRSHADLLRSSGDTPHAGS